VKPSSNSILVLHEVLSADARPDELDTLAQVEQISEALRLLGWNVSRLATDLDLQKTMDAINRQKPACVFNLVESLAGRGQLIHLPPAILAANNLSFTGSGADAMYLSSNKLLAKQWMRLNQLATPRSILPAEDLPTDELPGENLTWIVKSVWEHASFGMDDDCVVKGIKAARTRIRNCIERHGGDWFAEQFLDGREFNVAILEIDGQARILPIAEMAFIDFPDGKPKIVNYAAKWDESAAEYQATQRSFVQLAQAEHDEISSIALNCWEQFGLRGYARVDLRMDAAGKPWVLEINANPCLSKDAGFAAAAAQAGINYIDLIRHVLQTGID